MLKKVFAATLCVVLIGLAGCNDANVESTIQSTASKVDPKPITYINPLTGVSDILESDKLDNRPVAVMINNISVAQKVQTGLSLADIVYETEVEGGITRLMAVYKDITKVEKFGTVRSARYPYVDLAMGHNAIYVHHGQDNTYCAPHLKDTQAFTIGTNANNAGERIKNGLAYEHTLYGYGPKLWNVLTNKFNTKLDRVVTWQNFTDEKTELTFENVATKVSVPFSSSYNTVFQYDQESGKYIRYFKNTLRTDYFTGESLYFKNIFILSTDITNYPDGKHRKVALESGEGYYCVNGSYMPILWSKGDASDSFVFTDTNGQPITVNQGNSWVCIPKKGVNITFE